MQMAGQGNNLEGVKKYDNGTNESEEELFG
jgi:hypothetical protein